MTILLRQPPHQAPMFERIFAALDVFLSGYTEDGATPEGIAYWRYGFGYFVYFAQALFAHSNRKTDLLAGEKIRRIAQFPSALGLAQGRFVNFSDAPEDCPLEVGLLTFLRQRFGVSVPPSHVTGLHRDHCYRFAHLSRNLFWSEGNLDAPLESGAFLFPELGWAIHRQNGVVLAVKGGHNDEPHNHNDLGQFVLHAHGDTLLCDLGRGQYTKDYFGEQRYELLHSSSTGHNVARINHQTQVPGQDHHAVWLESDTSPDHLNLRLELSGAYPQGAVKHYQRHFEWQNGVLHLHEHLQFEQPDNHLEFGFVSLYPPAVSGKSVVWQGKYASLRLEYPVGFVVELETIQTKAHLGEDLQVFRVWLVKRADQDENLTFVLTVETP
jgi:hypothetical protein